MKKTEQEKYDPEDIESLMIHKSFTDLYPEERAFVLKHLDSELEYESMRNTLISVQSRDKSDRISPPPRMKKELLQMMDGQRKKGIVVWLNGFFPFVSANSRVPAFAMGSLSIAAVLVAVFLMFPSSEPERFSDLEDKFKNKQVEQESAAKKDELLQAENEVKLPVPSEVSEDLKPMQADEEAANQVAELEDERDLSDEMSKKRFAENGQSNIATVENKSLTADANQPEAADNLTWTNNSSTPIGNVITTGEKFEEEVKIAESIAMEEPNLSLDDEFHFDNQMGNMAEMPESVQLSEVQVASKASADFSNKVVHSGALFDSENRLLVSAKANETLSIIDVLYTAY